MENNSIIKGTIATLAIGGTLLFLKKKSDFSKVIQQMTIDVRNIRNLRMKGTKLYMDIDIAFTNPTQYNMVAYTAGMIKVKQIKLFYKNALIGSAFSNATKFELPAKSEFVITGVTLELLYLDIINQFLGSGIDTNVNNYQVHTIIEALGKTWIIE